MDGDTFRTVRVVRRQLQFMKLEKLGEVTVRARVASGKYSGEMLHMAQDWLSRFDAERDATNEMRRDEISEEHLRLASSANDHAAHANAIAKRANTIAAIAMITAVIAIAVSIIMPLTMR